LIHWEKCGDENMFSPDNNYYYEFASQKARWDCIMVLQVKKGA
jgi:hypothetical protein